jgi:hypothetical protein
MAYEWLHHHFGQALASRTTPRPAVQLAQRGFYAGGHISHSISRFIGAAARRFRRRYARHVPAGPGSRSRFIADSCSAGASHARSSGFGARGARPLLRRRTSRRRS